MEFGKLKGFWKTGGLKADVPPLHHKNCALPESKLANSNNNSNRQPPDKVAGRRIESLEEIRPEVTSEGYGLRTPYGTHLNLDFVKYCEDLMSGQSFKRTSSFRRPRSRTTSHTSGSQQQQQQHSNNRLTGGPSNESLDSLASDSTSEGGKAGVPADKTLMETRRRLEAFRSFRSRRPKANGEAPIHNHVMRSANNTASYTTRRGSNSPAGSSSGSLTPNAMATSSHMTSQHLQVVREQMAAALSRLRDLEEQVKTIPVLQVKISVLQQEKKHLLEELRQAENRTSPQKSILEESEIFGHSKQSPRKSLLSTSSGFSSSSSQSSISSPRSPPPTPSHAPDLETCLSLKGSAKSPPLPPKRKYRSTAAGSDTPMDEVAFYSKSDRTETGSHCEILREIAPPETADFSFLVEPCMIDAANGVLPQPPKQYSDRGCATFPTEVVDSQSQTTCNMKTSSTQSSVCTRSIGFGDHAFYQMVDRSCGGNAVPSRDVGVATLPVVKDTETRSCSTDGLVTTNDVCTGNHVELSSVGTSTAVVEKSDVATSSAGLLQTADAGVGVHIYSKDQCVETLRITTNDVSVECDLVEKRQVEHQSTNTDNNLGRWRAFVDARDVSCGDGCVDVVDKSVNVCVSTNDQCTNARPDVTNAATSAEIRKPTSDCALQTPTTVTYESSTDCDDILPIMTSSTTNTQRATTSNATTQYLWDKIDEATDTDDLTKPKAKAQIDDYVDQVQSLLEEQQSLLAEKYDGFNEVFHEPPAELKVSRFVNPAFTKKDAPVKDEQSTPTSSAAISASFHYMKSAPESESESEDEEDDYVPLHVPSPVDPADLKSILKKPDTPQGEKKFLTFAEGVKSDDSSSEEDYSSSEDEDEVVGTSKKDKKPSPEVVEEEKAEEVVEEIIEEKIVHQINESTSDEDQKLDEDRPETVEVEVKQEMSLVEAMSNMSQAKVIEERIVGDGAEDTGFQENPTKYQFTTEVLDACDVIEMHLRTPKSVERSHLEKSTSIVQKEWFRVAAQTDSSTKILDDFVTDLADTSLPVLRKVVNMTDNSGNTVLHYAISHNNIEIVEALLKIDELDVNKHNQAGYTAAMLGSLCQADSDADLKVFKRLFEKSNVNTHAKEAGQTALMLAVSHGRLQTAKLLIECGADINARDADGSTPLMCAAEHAQRDIVKMLLSQPLLDAAAKDSDGSTALTIAMEAGHREIALLLYTRINFKSNPRAVKPKAEPSSMIPRQVRRKAKS